MSPKTHLHLCAAEGCTKSIAAHLLMCIHHWKMVPRALQRQIRRTFRAMLHSPAHDTSSMKDYRTAVRDAVAAVREKEIKRALKNQQHGDNLDLQAPERYAGETPRPE